MPHDHAFWERMLPAIRGGDPDEVVRQLRHLLDADPFQVTPRHWLAEVHRRNGASSAALAQYDRLLPLAVGAGDLFRALAVQKRLDELDPRPGTPERLAAIQRWFRLRGAGHLREAPSTRAEGLSARVMMRLPTDVFVHAAMRATLEDFELEPRILGIEGDERLVVLWGEIVWDLKLPDGRRPVEQRAVEGDLLRAHPGPAHAARLRVRPDTPAQCLRFGERLLTDLVAVEPAIAGPSPYDAGGIVREERPPLPAGPRRPADIDFRSLPLEPNEAGAPPRLELGDSPEPNVPSAIADVESWVGYASLTLDPRPLDLSAPPATPDPSEFEIVDLDGSVRPRPDQPPVAGPVTSPEAGEGAVSPPARDPFATGRAGAAGRAERRSGERTACEIGGRVRLMGVGSARHAEMECRVFDISAGGVGVSFDREDIVRAIAMLEDETLRVELDVPGEEPLRVAARMRWVDLGQPERVRAGLQFVLLAPSDRAVIERMVGVPAGPSRPD